MSNSFAYFSTSRWKRAASRLFPRSSLFMRDINSCLYSPILQMVWPLKMRDPWMWRRLSEVSQWPVNKSLNLVGSILTIWEKHGLEISRANEFERIYGLQVHRGTHVKSPVLQLEQPDLTWSRAGIFEKMWNAQEASYGPQATGSGVEEWASKHGDKCDPLFRVFTH